MDIWEVINEIKEEVIVTRRYIHEHPELSLKEFKTSDLIESELKKIEIKVKRDGLETGVIGLLEGKYPGKTIALRADIDALPIEEKTGSEFSSKNKGVMHACGHDLHTAILIGCTKVLSKFRDELKGNIKFIFQPAEERLCGSKKMIQKGVLEDPKVDAIIALHCWPELPVGTIGLKKGALMASSDTLQIKIKGKAGHAAHPHKCIDPITIAAFTLAKLQTIVSRESSPIDPVVVTMGKINAGTAHNIIPSEVTLEGTVRTVNHQTQRKMPEMISRIVKYTAKSMKGDAEIDYKFGSPPIINNSNLVNLVDKTVTDFLGEDKVICLENPSMGGEDFAFYLEKVPGILIRLGTVNENEESKLPLHNPRIIFDEKAISTGIAVMCKSAIAYLKEV